MIQAKKITITRAEGPTELCKTRSFEGPDCWEHARNWLHGQSWTYPQKGGYDKHDFVVEFEDGDTYEGRLDCKHHDCEDADLDVASHIRQFVEFMAGVRCPSGKSSSEFEATLDTLHRRGETTREEYKKFLATYSLGA
jgi:hypothetical protein